jgi:hypothetical protein
MMVQGPAWFGGAGRITPDQKRSCWCIVVVAVLVEFGGRFLQPCFSLVMAGKQAGAQRSLLLAVSNSAATTIRQ